MFSVFFMDNFHGKHVDNMQRSWDRRDGFSHIWKLGFMSASTGTYFWVHNCAVREEQTVSELIKHGHATAGFHMISLQLSI